MPGAVGQDNVPGRGALARRSASAILRRAL
jgi:hypothetical protein